VNMQTLGLVAGVLTTAAWLPQIARTWRSRSAADLSWPYLLVFSLGVSLWLLYGVLSNDVPVLAANAVTIVLVGLLLGLKSRTAIRASALRQAEAETEAEPEPV
jgi:MtN3 and saliva related transmembrane protein